MNHCHSLGETCQATVSPRVLLVGPDFSGGGGERHFTNLCRHLFQGTCDILVLRNSSGEIPAGLRPGSITNLGWANRWSYPGIIRLVRETLIREKYDCCLGFGLFPSIVVYLSSFGTRISTTIISMEITRPVESIKQSVWWRRILYTGLRKITYGGSDCFVANSIDGILEAATELRVDAKKAHRVPNIVENEKVNHESGKPNPFRYNQPYIVCVSRLVDLKRIDNVIEAFAKVANLISSNLLIVGDGPARTQLVALADSLGISGRVAFTGHVLNPFPIMRQATCFVSASEYEGLSNSILEAMFCDVPVITSLCSSDAQEMYEHGAALGFIVGDADQLAKHIVAVVTDESLAQNLVDRAKVYRTPHSLELAIPVYEDLIRRLARQAAVGCEDNH